MMARHSHKREFAARYFSHVLPWLLGEDMAAHQQDHRRPERLQGGVPSISQPPALIHHHTLSPTRKRSQVPSLSSLTTL